MNTHFSTKAPVGRVKGLGSAHEGTKHWWMQRITAIVLVPLTMWLVVTLMSVAGKEREEVIICFSHPLTAIALGAVILGGIYHGLLGIQVILEDYVHTEWLRIFLLWSCRLLGCLLLGLSIVSIIIMVFHRFMSVD